MKPGISVTLAFAVWAGISAAPLAADQAPTLAHAEVPQQVEPRPSDSVNAAARLDGAKQLMREGRFREARREYAAIAKQQKKDGVLAGEALWELGGLYFAAGNLRRAADTFDELAKQAETYGDPVLQAKALLEAAIMYQDAGMGDRALTCYNRLQPLLDSPFLSGEAREAITRRIHPA